MGVFESRVEGQHFPFIPPFENGGHEQTRWLTLSDKDGSMIEIMGKTPFHFDVHNNDVNDYLNAMHEHELIRKNEIFLHIDAFHCGIGGDMGWSTVLKKEDRVEAKDYWNTKSL